ncbi:MAG TPA: VWA domain-containing protein [Gemmatimonadales bacterium]|nr:VWA domain-containing protein [Gemmatimonadales bacterium]
MIGFLYPWALAGLAAAAIPLLLHFRAQREPPTVVFPAVRYLRDATRQHERRLLLRQWLLLLLRTLLVVALVLAAAGPTVPLGSAGPHAPMALVLVLDNSLSSGVTVGGTPRLAGLRRAALDVLARAGAGDRLWLLTADGIPRRGDPLFLRRVVDSLQPSGMRMDLGAAVDVAGRIVDGAGLPGGVVVLSDLQGSALSAAATRQPVLVGAPSAAGAPPPNLGVASVLPGAEPWSPDGGTVTVTVAGDHDSTPVPVTITLGAGPPRQALVGPGRPAVVTLPGGRAGWSALTARLDPDELRGDDARTVAVRVAPTPRVAWSASDRYVAAALATLVAGRRAVAGDGLRVGSLGAGPSVVFPPADPALVGALDRALAARGVAWRYGPLLDDTAAIDSSAWLRPARVWRRYRLVPNGSGRTGVLITVGGEPWLVRSGPVLLLGSRLEPAWTELPLVAGFVPFIDALVGRIAPGEESGIEAAVGTPVLLPGSVDQVRWAGGSAAVEGGAAFTAPRPGLYWLVARGDTVGALAANADPRESDLAEASGRAVRSLWPTARVVTLDDVPAAAFGLAERTDLRGPLLWAALLLAVVELFVAGAGAPRRGSIE